jgi:hypothetical protein
MSQNIIKIKRGDNFPSSLTAGELAYSYGQKKLYIGSTAGTPIEIGGEDFVAGPTFINFFTPNSGGATTTAFLGETIDLVGVNGVTVTGDSTDKVFFGLNVTGATKNNGDPIITTTTDQDGRVVIAIPNNAINSQFLDPNTFIRQFSTPKRGTEREGRIGFATVEKQGAEIYTGTTSANLLAGGGETSFIDVNPHYFGLRVGNGATSFVGVDVDGGSRLDTLSLTGTNGISISSSAALTANTVNDLLTLTISSLPRQYNASGTSLTANINENLNFTGSSNIVVAGSNKTITFSTVTAPTFAGLSVTGNANVTGTLTVTGQSTLGNVNASGLTATTIRGNTSVSTPQLIATGGNFSGALTAGSGSFGSLSVTQDMSVSGNLTVLGSVVTLDVENVKIEDPIIALAKGNTVSDTIQTGFVVRYEPTVPQFPDTFAGLIRDPSSKRFVFFEDSGGSLTSSSYTLTNKASIEVDGISASGTIQSPTLSTGTILGAVIDGGTF